MLRRRAHQWPNIAVHTSKPKYHLGDDEMGKTPQNVTKIHGHAILGSLARDNATLLRNHNGMSLKCNCFALWGRPPVCPAR